MRLTSITFLVLLILGHTSQAQRQVRRTTVEIKPENGRGFVGKLDLEYAFENCFGETHMLYTYDNVKLTSFAYEGSYFEPRDLGLQSFDEYLISPEIIIDIIKPVSFRKSREAEWDLVSTNTIVSDKRLTNVLDTQLAGCYGQTYKVGAFRAVDINSGKLRDEEHLDPKYLRAKGKSAHYKWSDVLSQKARCKIDPDCVEREDNYKPKTNDAVAKTYYIEFDAGISRYTGNSKMQASGKYHMIIRTSYDPKSMLSDLGKRAFNSVQNHLDFFNSQSCGTGTGYTHRFVLNKIYAENARIKEIGDFSTSDVYNKYEREILNQSTSSCSKSEIDNVHWKYHDLSYLDFFDLKYL